MCNFHHLLTQPLHSSEQHTRANLEFSSNFAFNDGMNESVVKGVATTLMTLLHSRGQSAKLKVNTVYINGGLVLSLIKQGVINF